MTSHTLKIKINNSYESEPSSGSGSSIDENNDCLNLDNEERIHLPSLLQPTALYDAPKPTPTERTTKTNSKSPAAAADKKQSWQLQYGFAMPSSQESPFEGFCESHGDQLWHKLCYPSPKRSDAQLLRLTDARKNTEFDPSPGKTLFAKFYDTIVEDNSCNAVDMQSHAIQPQEPPLERTISNVDLKEIDAPRMSSELSFNGKIGILTASQQNTENTANDVLDVADTEHFSYHQRSMNVSLNGTQLSDSFVLKKYSNERSPDIFADDEEEDVIESVEDINELKIEVVAINTSNVRSKAQVAADTNANRSLNCPTESSFGGDQTLLDNSMQSSSSFREICRRERAMLQRMRQCLAGVPPPPSMTIPQLDLVNSVLSQKQQVLSFASEVKACQTAKKSDSSCATGTESLLRPTHTLEEAKAMDWRSILSVRQHGLCYNVTKASERNEYLNLSVIERFIGAETASSYRKSPSSAKKRNMRMKLLTQSPGNRLSHLAKRRAVFSSANLATTSQKSQSAIGPQILIDKRKPTRNKRKSTPKRASPQGSKKKARKTPSSSARKRLFRCDLVKPGPGPSRETSKRALFQSPAKQLQQQKYILPKPTIKPEIANRVEKSKRALFSPDKRTQNSFGEQLHDALNFGHNISSLQLESLLKRKRDPDEDTDGSDLSAQSSKLFRVSGENLTPRALKIKSQSFCIGAGTGSTSGAVDGLIPPAISIISSSRVVGSSSRRIMDGDGVSTSSQLKMQRAYSDMVAPSNSLTDNQRKKLLWAVSQALQEKKISAKHESFKLYASALARIVRRIFQEYYQKWSTSNSETMLRLSKKYVYSVICGKTVDEIYLQAKTQIEDNKRRSNTRISGYIGPEEYQKRKITHLSISSLSSTQHESPQLLSQLQTQCSTQQQLGASMQSLLSIENSVDGYSMSASQTSSVNCTTSIGITATQSSFLGQINEELLLTQNSNSSTKSASKHQLPIQTNPTLQNSSSKNNLGGMALRENVDCEQRRSAQKNFTGKDQRNVSPYAAPRLGSALKAQVQLPIEPSTSGASMGMGVSGTKAKRQICFDS